MPFGLALNFRHNGGCGFLRQVFCRVQMIIISALLPQCSHLQTCLNLFPAMAHFLRIKKGGA